MNDVGSMTVKKIKIGISQRIVNEENYVERRDAISHDWSNLLEKIDFIPVLIVCQTQQVFLKVLD